MEDILIRKASTRDLDQLSRLEQLIIEAERPFDPTLKRTETNYYDLQHMIDAENVLFLVAESDHRVIATGYARIENAKPYVQHLQHAYLGFMFVLPEYRGKGLNKRIIDELHAWALSKNVPELRLEVYSKNLSAIRAYEKLGFATIMIEMRLNSQQ